MSKEIQNNSQEVDINLDELLGVPGAGTVITPDEDEKKKNTIFTPKKDAVSEFLDNLGNGDDNEEETVDEQKQEPTQTELPKQEEKQEEEKQPEDQQQTETKQESQEEEQEPVEKKKYKTASSIFENLIDKGVLMGYEGKDKIEDYSQEELETLVQDNIENIKVNLQQDVVNEFIGSLPEEFTQAWKYYQDGGTDIKAFLRTIGNVKEVTELDINDKNDQKVIIREYLKAKEWGTEDEIEDEINDIDDRGDLKKKAEKFKPMLEASQQKIVEQKLKKQEELKKQRQEAVRVYREEVKSIVNADNLNGIPMDKKTRDMLYVGLVDTNYDSMSGLKTNKLGSLLEKYQFGKDKDMSLVAEAFWLLADPQSYRNSVMNVIIKSQSQNTMRKLKTEQQASKNGGSSQQEERREIPKRGDTNKIKRNFFDFG